MSCYCGLPEHLEVGEVRARDAHARWYLAGSLPGVPDQSLRMWIAEGMARWAAICGITAEEAPSASAAHLVIDCARIDGRQGVLAWCELPGPAQQRMRLDTSEAWVESANGPQRGGILLVNVLTHELGHFWGVGHGPAGCLMQPTYDPSIDRPQEWDIVEMVQRYGMPRLVPRTRPTPPEPDNDPIIYCVLLRKSGKVARKWRLNEEALELDFTEPAS